MDEDTVTHITEEDREILVELGAHNPNFALFSCFVDGKPSVAITYITHDEDGDYTILPLYVKVTDDMILTDHDGNCTKALS